MLITREEFWWAVHNLVAHPVSELCYWGGKLVPPVGRFGDWIHDATVPTHEAGTGRG
jgi:hypothetical protein